MANDVSYLDLQVLTPVGVLTSTFLGGFYIYRQFLRRVPTTRRIPERFFRKRSMLGRVTSVGDADNFHFYHTPGGIFTGWGWLRHAPVNKRGISNQTIHVRLCGIDAPEGAHFGKPAQKWSKESLDWLRNYILGKKVRIIPLAQDQYSRTVAEAKIWKLTGRKNVSAEMLKAGWAVVYESKTGSEFNGNVNEQWFRRLEKQARSKRIGMFHDKNITTPGEYKRQFHNK